MRDFNDTVNTAACFSIKKARLLAAFVCITVLLAGCDEAPDKEQIERNLAAMQEAVENKEFSAIKKYLHEGFRANDRLGAAEVKRLLQMYSLRHQNINVTVLATETEMNSTYPNRAQTTASVVVTGSSGLLPSDGSVRTVRIEWKKQSGDWRATAAQW